MYAVVLVPLPSRGWRLLGGESRRNASRGRMLSPLRWARLLLATMGGRFVAAYPGVDGLCPFFTRGCAHGLSALRVDDDA